MATADAVPQLGQLAGRPRLAASEIADLLPAWGISATVRELESERDQNWLLTIAGTPRHVLKIANRADTPELIEFQQQMMQRLADAGLPCPRATRTWDGRNWIRVGQHVAWLIDFRPGRRLVDQPEPTADVFTDLGEVLGRSTVALHGFDHPAAHARHLQWDVQHAEEVLQTYAGHVPDARRRALVDTVLAEFRAEVGPALAGLPRSVIHNDANDHNVLIEGRRVSGLLDFGDAVHSVTLNDLAIGCAYAMLDRPEPARVAELIVAGYSKHRPLDSTERQLLPLLIRTRLATSVAIAAYQQIVHPDNAYLRVSEGPAWRLLDTIGRARHEHR
jgi:Ser/Thr protein kinase RdoA (MazF antagonist)